MAFAKSSHQRHRPPPQKSGDDFQEGQRIGIVSRAATAELAERPHEAIRFRWKHGGKAFVYRREEKLRLKWKGKESHVDQVNSHLKTSHRGDRHCNARHT